MKWKNKMKRTATTTSAILLALMLAACSDNNNTPIAPTATPDTEQTDQGTIPSETLPDDTGVLDPGTPDPDQDDQGSNQPSENNNGSSNGQEPTETVSDVIKAEGTYIGAADSHTVEIQVGDKFLPLQVDEDLQHIISEYQGNEAVSFEYVEKTIDDSGSKQLWLKSIDKK